LAGGVAFWSGFSWAETMLVPAKSASAAMPASTVVRWVLIQLSPLFMPDALGERAKAVIGANARLAGKFRFHVIICQRAGGIFRQAKKRIDARLNSDYLFMSRCIVGAGQGDLEGARESTDIQRRCSFGGVPRERDRDACAGRGTSSAAQ
jgi:hypothetical protein